MKKLEISKHYQQQISFEKEFNLRRKDLKKFVKMETCDQNAVDRFSFSQELTSGLSRMYSQMSQMTTQSTDFGCYSGQNCLATTPRLEFDQKNLNF